MRLDRILGAASSIAGLALLVFMANAMQRTQQEPNNDYMASLAYPYIAIGLVFLFVGLYYLLRPKDSGHPSAVNRKDSEK